LRKKEAEKLVGKKCHFCFMSINKKLSKEKKKLQIVELVYLKKKKKSKNFYF
jgi:hypothetical protein